MSTSNRRQPLPQQQQQHVTPQQALYSGQRVISVRKILDNELALEQRERQEPASSSSAHQQQSRRSNSRSAALPAAASSASPASPSQPRRVGFHDASPSPSQQWAPHALIVPKASTDESKKKKSKRKKGSGQLPSRLADPYAMVKRAMAAEEQSRLGALHEQQQQLKRNAATQIASVRTRNLRFESPVLLRSAAPQPTSFVPPSQHQQQQQQRQRRQQDMRAMVNMCVQSECGRVFLTEEEARALSGGRVCYSVAQRTTAFGSSAPHTETVQEPFCLLAVSIARALVPGVSHAAMVRRAAALLSSPTWSQKLPSGLSLLAHGAVPVTLVAEQQQRQQQAPAAAKQDEQPKQIADRNPAAGDKTSASGKQPAAAADSASPPAPPAQAPLHVKSQVQWAMLHVAMDMPTLFVALYCAPAAEALLPSGFDAGGEGAGSPEELARVQRERHEEEQRRRKESRENTFAHNFIGKVFHNIGLEDDDYCDDDEDDDDDDGFGDDVEQKHDRVSSPAPVPPLALSKLDEKPAAAAAAAGSGGDGTGKPSGRIYNTAGEFIDEIFGQLLGRDDGALSPSLAGGGDDGADIAAANEGAQQRYGADEGDIATGGRREGSASSRSGGLDTAGVHHTVARLRFQSDAHRDVATQLCLAVETFLTFEGHGRKVRRLVVCAHSTSAPMACDVVTALRARQAAKGQSRRVVLVTTQANIAMSVPRRRLEGRLRAATMQTAEQEEERQQRLLLMAQEERQEERRREALAAAVALTGADGGGGGASSSSPAGRRTNSAGAARRPEQGALVATASQSQSPAVGGGSKARQQDAKQQQVQQQQQRQPDGKYSEWTAEERANALRLFFARLCIPVPKLTFDTERRRGWRFVVMPECVAWAIGYFAPGAVLSYQSLEFPAFEPAPAAGRSTPAAAADKNSKKSGGGGTDDSAPRSPSAGSRPPPPALPPSADDIVRHLWEALSRVEGCVDPISGGATLEGFVLASTTLLAGLVSRDVANAIWDEVFASKFTASMYPPGTPIPTPPPVCSCCGAIGADYFAAREATFIRQLKAHAPAAMKPFLKKALQRPFDPVPAQRFKPSAKEARHAKPRRQQNIDDDADEDDYLEQDDAADVSARNEAAANWNRAFFVESFHPPHEVLAKTDAQFLPPLTALFSTGSHVDRTAATYRQQGDDAAAKVRLRLQEQLYRADHMVATFA